MSAKPFLTLPENLVTRPTIIPPIELVTIGIRVWGVHWSKKPFVYIRFPSSLKNIDIDNTVSNAMHDSALKRQGLRPPDDPQLDALCRFFWEIAPARPDRNDANRTGATSSAKCFTLPNFSNTIVEVAVTEISYSPEKINWNNFFNDKCRTQEEE